MTDKSSLTTPGYPCTAYVSGPDPGTALPVYGYSNIQNIRIYEIINRKM